MEDDSEIIKAIQRKTGLCGLEARTRGSATKVPMLNFYHTLTTDTIFPGSSTFIHTALPWGSALTLTFWLLVTLPCQAHTLQKIQLAAPIWGPQCTLPCRAFEEILEVSGIVRDLGRDWVVWLWSRGHSPPSCATRQCHTNRRSTGLLFLTLCGSNLLSSCLAEKSAGCTLFRPMAWSFLALQEIRTVLGIMGDCSRRDWVVWHWSRGHFTPIHT